MLSGPLSSPSGGGGSVVTLGDWFVVTPLAGSVIFKLFRLNNKIIIVFTTYGRCNMQNTFCYIIFLSLGFK